jgi:hypothetical protein
LRTAGEGALNDDGVQIGDLVRNFAIEVFVYSLLIVSYFLLVLRFLGEPLNGLYTNNLVLYAFVALALIVIQAVALEWVTSFLIDRLGLERLE